jgi:hypothetical protein
VRHQAPPKATLLHTSIIRSGIVLEGAAGAILAGFAKEIHLKFARSVSLLDPSIWRRRESQRQLWLQSCLVANGTRSQEHVGRHSAESLLMQRPGSWPAVFLLSPCAVEGSIQGVCLSFPFPFRLPSWLHMLPNKKARH